MKVISKIFVLFFSYLGLAICSAVQIPTQSLTPPLPAKPGKQQITSEWLLAHTKPSLDMPVIKWLDNENIVYAFPKIENNKNNRIEKINIYNHERQILGNGLTPVPSPDGQWIVYTKGNKEQLQLWIMRSNGSEEKQLSNVNGGLGFYKFSFDFLWTADSKKIILSHQPYVPLWEHTQRAESKIDIIDIVSKKKHEIASIDGRVGYLQLQNNTLFFVKERIGLLYQEETDHEWIQSINLLNKQIKTYAHFKGLQQFLEPTLSLDGKQIAFSYDPDFPFFTIIPSIGVITVTEKINNSLPSINRLTSEAKFWVPQWSNDKKTIYALREMGAYLQLYSIDSSTGKLNQLTNAPLDIKSYTLSPDGLHIAYLGKNAHDTDILQVAKSNGSDTHNLIVKPGVSNDMALGEVREIEWPTTDYPTPMRGLLILPLNYKEETHYPLIVDIHGGDVGAHIYLMGGVLGSSPLEWQMWAAKGYAVFVPEFRSSGAFGSLAIMRDLLQEHNRLGGDLKDIEAGVDYLIAQGIADANRLTVIGHSAGSLRANWLTVTTHRYKAVVSNEGWADELTESLKNPPSKSGRYFYGGSPQEVPQNYLKNSALSHSKGATTPTLFLTGNPALGGVDPFNTMHMLYDSLKKQGIEAEFASYPDEGHVFEKPKNQQNALERVVCWIDDHI